MKSPHFYLALYMSLLGGNWIAYHLILPIRIAHHIILTAFLIWWLLKHGLPDTVLILPLLAMGAALGLSVMNAIDRRMALEFAWHWIVNWLLFLYLIDALRRSPAGDFFKGVFAAGLILGLSCLVEWLLVGDRPAGLFGVINLSGAYLAALIVPALGWFIASRNQRQRHALLFFICIAAVGVLLNQSRGPVLSVLVALTAFGFLSMRAHTILKVAMGAALMSLCAFVVVGLSSEPQHGNGDVIRMDLWSAGEDMLMSRGSGVGAGLFAQAYHGRTIGDRWTGAHNYYITLGAELGAPGLAAGAAVLLVGLYLVIQQERTLQQKAVLAAMLGILAHMLVDNYPAQNWTFLVSLYSAYLVYEVRWLNRRVPGTVNRLAVYGLVVYGMLFAMWDSAQIHYEQALQTGRMDEVAAALILDSHNRLYALEAAQLIHPDIVISPDYAITNFARPYYHHE